MFGPSLCAGGQGVTPRERRNSNRSTLAVVHSQDAVDKSAVFPVLLLAVDVVGKVALLSVVVDPPVDEPLLSVVVVDPPLVDEPLLSVDPAR